MHPDEVEQEFEYFHTSQNHENLHIYERNNRCTAPTDEAKHEFNRRITEKKTYISGGMNAISNIFHYQMKRNMNLNFVSKQKRISEPT